MAEYEYIKYIIRNKEPLRIADDSTSQSGQTVTLRYIPGTTMRGYIINKMAASSDFEQLKEELFSEQVKYLNAYLCVKEKNNEKNSRVRFKTLVDTNVHRWEDIVIFRIIVSITIMSVQHLI